MAEGNYKILKQEVSGNELSPGKSSQVRHYTVKEYEDDLEQLRDENCRLKLRIFLLEQLTKHPNAANNGVFGLGTSVDYSPYFQIEQLKAHSYQLEGQFKHIEYILQQERVHSNKLEADLKDAKLQATLIGVRCQGLQFGLQEHSSKLGDLLQELKQRGKDLAGCNLRIRELEEALNAQYQDIKF
jgi:chromosome segregation ATPase